MESFIVKVKYTCEFTKELTMQAKDANHAGSKALNLIKNWNNVVDIEIEGIERKEQ